MLNMKKLRLRQTGCARGPRTQRWHTMELGLSPFIFIQKCEAGGLPWIWSEDAWETATLCLKTTNKSWPWWLMSVTEVHERQRQEDSHEWGQLELPTEVRESLSYSETPSRLSPGLLLQPAYTLEQNLKDCLSMLTSQKRSSFVLHT